MRSFWDDMAAMRSLYSAQLDAVGREYGLARVELDILLFLANNPQFDTATEIVQWRNISKAHVSQGVKALEQRGYLERWYARDNRRTIHLRLRQEAGAAVEAGRAAQHRYRSLLFQGFSEEELEQFCGFFGRIAANARAQLKEGK